ncbi:MAG: hypothetical protein H0W06_12130 [Chloroflexia bacterium]|nr:hypothetical protein [Chloroflexia bacterium]
MPRKLRQLRSEALSLGMVLIRKRSKGSHTWYVHPDHPDLPLNLAGEDGDDARAYQERDLARAKRVIHGEDAQEPPRQTR